MGSKWSEEAQCLWYNVVTLYHIESTLSRILDEFSDTTKRGMYLRRNVV
jgi:hypothetical protein